MSNETPRPTGDRPPPNRLRNEVAPNVLRAAPGSGSKASGRDAPPPTPANGIDADTEPPRYAASPAELEAAGQLRDLAISSARAAELAQAALIEAFEARAAAASARLGELVVIETDSERLWLDANGHFGAQTSAAGDGDGWEMLLSPQELAVMYDPTDLFADVAARIGAAYGGMRPRSGDEAGARLRELAETYLGRARALAESNERIEVRLIEEFEAAAAGLSAAIGDLLVLDEVDERLTIERSGRVLAEVVPDDESGVWRKLRTPDEIVEFYAPRELFSHLVDALRRSFPAEADEDLETWARRLGTWPSASATRASRPRSPRSRRSRMPRRSTRAGSWTSRSSTTTTSG